jgi:DNA polymerase/3'-5' exonuclease PolX
MERVSDAIAMIEQQPESITLKERQEVNDQLRKLLKQLGKDYKAAKARHITGSQQRGRETIMPCQQTA